MNVLQTTLWTKLYIDTKKKKKKKRYTMCMYWYALSLLVRYDIITSIGEAIMTCAGDSYSQELIHELVKQDKKKSSK